MAQRGVRGAGTVFWSDSKQCYVGRKVVGNKQGRTLYAERRGRTQADVLRRLAAAGPPGPDETFARWAERWLAEMDCRPRTRLLREINIRKHVLPELGRYRVADLTTYRVEVASRNWREKGLAVGHVRQILNTLGTCLQAAVKHDLRPDNPVRLAKKPRLERGVLDPFTPAELRRIVREAAKRPACRIVCFLATTGVRLGEAIALDADEFDPAKGTVSISRTRGLGGVDGPPKTSNGVRTIRVPAPALAAVKAAHGGRTTGPLFPAEHGDRPRFQSVREAYGRLLRRLGIRYRSPHHLRHSFASHALASGYGAADVAKYLGDTPETVMRTYVHATGADVAAGVEKLLGENGKRR